MSFALETFFKILSLGVLITQIGILDYYVLHFVHKDNLGSLWWIVLTDLFILICWIESLGHWLFLKLYRKIKVAWRACTRQDGTDGGEGMQGNEAKHLRTAFLAWFLYVAVGLTPRIAVIFEDSNNIVTLADTGNKSAANTLRVVLGVTAVLFLTLNTAHKNAKPFSRRRYYLERISAGVTWDILDSVELLDTLFFLENHNLPVAMRNAIVGFACINLILPTISLLEMRQKWVEGSLGHRRLNFKILYIFSNLFLVNVPFLTIRVIVWHHHDLDISAFIVKNVICIYLNASDVWEFWGPDRPWRCPQCRELIIKQYVETHKQTHEGQEMKTEETNLDNQDVKMSMV